LIESVREDETGVSGMSLKVAARRLTAGYQNRGFEGLSLSFPLIIQAHRDMMFQLQ
jgi:hypothetical protein